MKFRIRRSWISHLFKIQYCDNYMSLFWRDTGKEYCTFDEAYGNMEKMIAASFRR